MYAKTKNFYTTVPWEQKAISKNIINMFQRKSFLMFIILKDISDIEKDCTYLISILKLPLKK